jgi:hypothetical protein
VGSSGVPSQKTAVIEYLFFEVKRYVQGHDLTDSVVTFDDIYRAIQETGANLKTNNLPNFWKDLTRTNPGALWPRRVLDAGYYGVDAIGDADGASFRFEKVPDGVADPYADLIVPSEDALACEIVLESVSMPIAMKSLGRTDENWLTQVGVRLRVIETHFALRSPSGASEISFLQTGVKLGDAEVDAAYSLVDNHDDTWLLAVEAKGRRERVHVSQVLRAAKELLRYATAGNWNVRGVIPMALKTMGASRLHVVEFFPDSGDGSSGEVLADSVVVLRPPVTGVE